MAASLYPEQLLVRRAQQWARTLKVNPKSVQIREMKDKWGSCAPDGVVTFADDLANSEEDFQDYVIVHELLHLRYRGHGRMFKAVLAAHIPQWRSFEERVSHQGRREHK